MSSKILRSHIKEESGRRYVLFSVVGHGALFLFFLYAGVFFPAADPLTIGSGPGGGQGGDFVSVGLAADVGGGAGMFKPSIVPRPQAVTPPPQREREAEKRQTEKPTEEVFVEKATRAPKKPAPKPSGEKTESRSEVAGAIPRAPDPGKSGTASSTGGSGGGFGAGQGVQVGSGTGEGVIDSWYIRQVEQRIGQNWLNTSLGRVEGRVQVIASFVVRPDGQIEGMSFDKRSGISSVDLAVERAIRASSPLPPLPYELRSRTVRFQAVFEYPPK